MQYERCMSCILDLLEEQQLKLGYRREQIRLYIPRSSLEHLLGKDNLPEALAGFAREAEETLGRIHISHKGDRYCFAFPEQAAEYVHSQTAPDGFLAGLISMVQEHGVTLPELLDYFRRFGKRLHAEQMTGEEFDYLLYYEDGIPNDYRYCFTFEGPHITYHRFLPEDYQDYGFEQGTRMDLTV